MDQEQIETASDIQLRSYSLIHTVHNYLDLSKKLSLSPFSRVEFFS